MISPNTPPGSAKPYPDGLTFEVPLASGERYRSGGRVKFDGQATLAWAVSIKPAVGNAAYVSSNSSSPICLGGVGFTGFRRGLPRLGGVGAAVGGVMPAIAASVRHPSQPSGSLAFSSFDP
jgi:hypothetical protein